jgi:hypothetical protein
MAKVIDIKAPPATAPEKTNLAAAVEPKLAEARTRLAYFEAQVGNAALAASLDEPGASKNLANLNGQLEAARRDVAQLEQAHLIALERDKRSAAAFDAFHRRIDLAKLEAIGKARLEAMTTLCGALATAGKSYVEFLQLTADMAAAWPTGLVRTVIAWRDLDTLLPDGVSFPAPIDKIVASEMYRLAGTDEQGRLRPLPGADPLIELLRLQPLKIEPATEAVARSNGFLIGTIRYKLDEMERANAEPLAKSA